MCSTIIEQQKFSNLIFSIKNSFLSLTHSLTMIVFITRKREKKKNASLGMFDSLTKRKDFPQYSLFYCSDMLYCTLYFSMSKSGYLKTLYDVEFVDVLGMYACICKRTLCPQSHNCTAQCLTRLSPFVSSACVSVHTHSYLHPSRQQRRCAKM